MAAVDVDVLVVGAGLSGIGAGCHLERDLPATTYAIWEARDASGGTWDLFRYPGVRSDSDMFTLGYRFRPWPGEQVLADGASILAYVRETAQEYGVEDKIAYDHRVTRAEWSSTDRCWTVTAQHAGRSTTVRARMLWMCSGYYDYEAGYQPDFAGLASYEGRFVHPQLWPEDLDVTGRRVVVIGSGATAVTLVPALAETAEQVTMLQRSPTYILPLPSRDSVSAALHRWLPGPVADAVTRWKNVLTQNALYQLARRRPGFVRGLVRKANVAQLPQGYDVDTHFRPRYDPWDQRLCLVPDGDLFAAVRRGGAEVVTDTIETFTAEGIRLGSGRELAADVVVSATGLNLLAFGGVELVVDGEPLHLPDTVAYQGMMLSGVPNFVFTIGYTNASWTLKADLVAEYAVRVLRELGRTGRSVFEPTAPPAMKTAPFLDFAAGYVLRSVEQLPRQGSSGRWRMPQNYLRDAVRMRLGRVRDDALRLS
ncbi:NAD(P)/FAD-dependent oxidoreductase [Nocardioides mangrovicus]|uniref:NAD(P)/FAD-dependent oxidoreductase n=1 Tax=Nocardioides mangrovicus TaxID=2478913 RepID=A0A3L8NYB2_9ACTN|nr:NAD(P)/FAD-dependent oxidoreductase [Nocardioides mangrovicus]RLV48140.1 NAD(P)/FAD-dependent oxidoreductase [Nocardioides mangrovicus]